MGTNEGPALQCLGILQKDVMLYLHQYKKGPFAITWHRNDELFEEVGHATDLFAEQAIESFGGIISWLDLKKGLSH